MDNSPDKSPDNTSNPENQEANLFSEEFDKEDVVNPSIDENDPFGEEFDKEDVVNSPDEPLNKKITSEDIDRLVAYDNERRKDISFIEQSYNYPGMESKDLSIDEALRKNFNDFLIAPKISGDNTRPIHTNRLPADHIKQGDGIVEILEDKEFLDQGHEHSSVILNRSPEGELENIEILCKCGEKTLIKFDYAEDEMELTELEGKKLRERLDVKTNVIVEDSQEKIFSDIDGDNSEVEIVDRRESAEPPANKDIVSDSGSEGIIDGEDSNTAITDNREIIESVDESPTGTDQADECAITENEIDQEAPDNNVGRESGHGDEDSPVI